MQDHGGVSGESSLIPAVAGVFIFTKVMEL